MLIELRIYHCLPGRLPALHQRFENVTLALWRKHGIEQAGFFTTAIGPSNQTLTYLLKWDSLAQREVRWNAFLADPEWIAQRAASEADAPIVAHIDSSLLSPTAYSALR
ncbi:NIPSNAP family protein [Duganella sp. BuS-21]|uniref:NIPSNAP family protein n=1 Tax=Duganella sp. BuS-21 TaxID=2943848 RepID=UPI0035A5D96B